MESPGEGEGEPPCLGEGIVLDSYPSPSEPPPPLQFYMERANVPVDPVAEVLAPVAEGDRVGCLGISGEGDDRCMMLPISVGFSNGFQRKVKFLVDTGSEVNLIRLDFPVIWIFCKEPAFAWAALLICVYIWLWFISSIFFFIEQS